MKEGGGTSISGAVSLSHEKGLQTTKALRLVCVFIKNLLIFSLYVLASFLLGVGFMGQARRKFVQVAATVAL